MAQPGHLLVGLGNPGRAYETTRHNIGFMALEAIASSVHASAWQRKFKGLIATAQVEGQTVLLLKPATFMNLSGESVREAMQFYKLEPASVIVFHDDLDLMAGRVKVKQGGGNAGHNGLKSIDAHIGADYWRVRLGIGHPGERALVHDYVLGAFAKADRSWLDPLFSSMGQALPCLLQGQTETFVRQCGKAS